MITSLYPLTIPTLVRSITNFKKILERTRRHAKLKKINERVFLEGRLAPDMFTLIEQVQYICFMALEIAIPLSGKKGPELGYDETTLDDCMRSLDKTLSYLRKIKSANFTKTNAKEITLFFDRKKTYKPEEYLVKVGYPNFFFHLTTGYDILRHLGVPLRKDDYLGPL